MEGIKTTRIDVFSELVSPKGTFDYDKCSQLLGENYDSFVYFCDAVNQIPEEIDTMTVMESETSSALHFEVTTRDGQTIVMEK